MEQLGEATAGGVAGIVSTATLYPLFVVKTRIQSSRKLKNKQSSGNEEDENLNPITRLLSIAKLEGLRGLYKGLSTSLSKAFLTNFIFYYVFSVVKPVFKKYFSKWPQLVVNMLQGVVAGVVVQCCVIPVDLVNTRIVATKEKSTSVLQMFAKIFKEEGFTGFYNKGFVPAMILTLNPGITNVVRQYIVPAGGEASNSKNFWTGAVSKAVASFCTYPYVVAKVQMYTYSGESEKNHTSVRREVSVAKDHESEPKVTITVTEAAQEYTLLGCLGRIVRQEGVLGLYKGIETQLSTAVLKEALLNMARYPIYRFIMSLFVKSKRE